MRVPHREAETYAGLEPRTPGSQPETKVDAQPLSHPVTPEASISHEVPQKSPPQNYFRVVHHMYHAARLVQVSLG